MEAKKIITSNAAAAYLRGQFNGLDHEEVWVLYLTSKNAVIEKKLINIGTLKNTMIDRRRIVKGALMNNAVSVILFHNHPGSDPNPSAADINATKELRSACSLFDLALLDHIIISDDSFFSFAEGITNKY